MSTGADSKTMPVTQEYEDGFKRTFGDRKPQRGRWVADPETGKLIPAEQYVPKSVSKRVPVVTDRYYEGTRALDANRTDIGSRRKRTEYMKRRGLIDQADFTPQYIAREREHKQRQHEKNIEKAVIEAVMRHDKP